MAIHLLTGRPRHGKTYELVKIGIKKLIKGERVFSNVHLNTDHFKKIPKNIIGDLYKKEDRDNSQKQLFYWQNLHDLEHMEKGTILCDEAQRYFNARRWPDLSEETEIKLQQHGKDNLDIFGTVQHYRRIDVSLRELVETWSDIETIFGNPDNKKPLFGIKIFKYTQIEGIELFEPYIAQKINPNLQLDIPHKKRVYFFRKKYGNAYDTLQKIAKSAEMPLIHGERTCPECGKTLITHH